MRVVYSTRDGRRSQLAGESGPPTPQMWNHSSRSTVKMLRTCSGRARTLLQNEGVDGVDRSQRHHAGLLVADRHAEAALELEHEFEHVDRIETEPFLEEQRRIVPDVGGGNGQTKAPDDR